MARHRATGAAFGWARLGLKLAGVVLVVVAAVIAVAINPLQGGEAPVQVLTTQP